VKLTMETAMKSELRKDALRNRAAVYQALKLMSGAQITATQIAELSTYKIHASNVNCWLRRMAREGVIKVEGCVKNKNGRVITVLKDLE
jgi:hypothetical protein